VDHRSCGAYRITLRWLERLQQTHGARHLVLLDVGSGYGGMLRRIAAGAARAALASS
jgi:cyclopropane fatty-acyl-phospholipid synthase-like methyltransferase